MTAPTAPALLSVEAARDAVLAVAEPVGTETVAAADAFGRVTASTVTARVSLPPWPNSAMDGYAIVAADTVVADEATPLTLRVIGDIAAGCGARRHGRTWDRGADRDRRPAASGRRCGRPGRGHDATRCGRHRGTPGPRRHGSAPGRLPGP